MFPPSQANTSVKVIEGHYTGHFKSVVTKPQNVFVLKDIMSNGYRAGANAQFFMADGDFTAGQQNIADRLNMDNYDSADKVHASLLAFPMSSGQEQKMHNEITVTSRLLPYDVHNQNYDQFPGGKEIHEFYKGKLQLDQIHFGEDLRASENMEYMSQGSVNNSLCFAGPHRKFDGVTGAYTKFVPGLGHCKSRVLNLFQMPIHR